MAETKQQQRSDIPHLPWNRWIFLGLMLLFCLSVFTSVTITQQITKGMVSRSEIEANYNAPSIRTTTVIQHEQPILVQSQTTQQTLPPQQQQQHLAPPQQAQPPPQQAQPSWGHTFPQTYFGSLWPETFWPTKTPRELFPGFDSCKVEFRDKSMATCHLAAFGGNFGDMLGPDIVKRAVEYRFGCDASDLHVVDFDNNTIAKEYPGPCLFTVGSVMRNVRPNDHVYGTGILGQKIELTEGNGACSNERLNGKKFKNVTVYSVRGPRSVALLKKHCEFKMHIASYDQLHGGRYDDLKLNLTRDFDKLTPAGDAGFLVPFLFPELLEEAKLFNDNPQPYSSQRDKPDCVIMHHYDSSQWEKHKVTPDSNTTKLLPVVQPWQTMVKNITQCRVVSSSSLHGLILADAYGIPARWIRGTSNIIAFKYLDYGESFGIRHQGHPKTNQFYFQDVIGDSNLKVPETKSYAYRSAYAMKIMENFPFHLFEAVETTEATK